MSNNSDILKMFEDSLKDLSPSEAKVMKAVALSRREAEAKRPGLVKFWSAIYCLLHEEQRRRKKEFEKAELELLGLQEEEKPET